MPSSKHVNSFWPLVCYGRAIEQAVAREQTMINCPYTVREAAIATYEQLLNQQLITVDANAKSWSMTQTGAAFLNSLRKKPETDEAVLYVLMCGFLIGLFNANDPTLTLQLEHDYESPYHVYYMDLCEVLYRKLEIELEPVSNGQTPAVHGPDCRVLTAKMFSTCNQAYAYIDNVRAKLNDNILNFSLLAIPNAEAELATFLFETDFMHITVGVAISAAL